MSETGDQREATLGRLLVSIEDLDPDATIYASKSRPLSFRSRAVAAVEGSTIPEGLTYLLEVSLARDVIAAWSLHRNGRRPSPDDLVAAVVYYADHDAYLPTG